MNVLTDERFSGKLIPVKNGWAACPICREPRFKRIRPNETAALVYVHCRRCKNDIPIMLKQGQCFESQGQQ